MSFFETCLHTQISQPILLNIDVIFQCYRYG